MKDMMKNHEDYEDAEEAARWYTEDAARLHALKVVEVLKNEIKVNEDVYFDEDGKYDTKLLEGESSAVNKMNQHEDESMLKFNKWKGAQNLNLKS